MANWVEEIGNQLWGVAEAFGAEMRGQGLLSLLRPVAPFNRPSFLAPAVTVGALITFLMLSGVAVTALGALLTALLALYLLLVEVFAIPGGRMLHVVPKAMRDQAVVMSVKLMDGSRALVDTDVRLQNRGVMLFGVGQDSRAAEGALIIMLRAED